MSNVFVMKQQQKIIEFILDEETKNVIVTLFDTMGVVEWNEQLRNLWYNTKTRKNEMITGEIKNKIDSIWDDFFSLFLFLVHKH